MNGINGLVLLPNNWDASIYTLNESNNLLSDFNSNIISANEWITILEANGAVFLPAAGQRVGNVVSNVGYDCNYWSSLFRNPYGDTGPVRLKISNEFINTRIMYPTEGYSVRLVKDYNP